MSDSFSLQSPRVSVLTLNPFHTHLMCLMNLASYHEIVGIFWTLIYYFNSTNSSTAAAGESMFVSETVAAKKHDETPCNIFLSQRFI